MTQADFDKCCELLRKAQARLDASYCEGRIVGPDSELFDEIEYFLLQHKRAKQSKRSKQ